MGVSLGFDDFVASARPRLWRGLAGACGPERASDATAEALVYAWRHWERVGAMDHPVAYLYRVGVSKARVRRKPLVHLPVAGVSELPDIEPALVPALLALPETQRTAVWLVHACGWSYAEVAAAMEIGTSTVGTHVSRGLASLRASLGVEHVER